MNRQQRLHKRRKVAYHRFKQTLRRNVHWYCKARRIEPMAYKVQDAFLVIWDADSRQHHIPLTEVVSA
ncbi:hypothetical protein [Alicyclobacillus sp. SO9]|uniref:hypothetical protein n=1 Tax=Alicyclobacillus sp. SO9 TaxID=2665646 RepID=UPI0018E7B469|nr:hypothetical protein [Alicyclobacillus sp. SO9]QQE80918.1 hypothetical protein GI364_11335 [Alicyclobacillus sp. SO9]